MNKTYQSPRTDICLVEAQQILAGSPLRENADGTVTQTLGAETDATSGNLSRNHSLWDDDEAE